MMKRPIIKFKVREISNKVFEMYAEPTFKERTEIENIVLEMCGGIDVLQSYRTYVNDYQERAKSPGFIAKADDLSKYLARTERLRSAYNFGYLKVLTVSSPVEIDTVTTEQFDQISSAYEVALEFFRTDQSPKKNLGRS